MSILKHADCKDLEKLADQGFKFPAYGELASDLRNIQSLKRAFFRRFWMVSGREAVRAIAATQLKAVSTFLIVCLVGGNALRLTPFV